MGLAMVYVCVSTENRSPDDEPAHTQVATAGGTGDRGSDCSSKEKRGSEWVEGCDAEGPSNGSVSHPVCQGVLPPRGYVCTMRDRRHPYSRYSSLGRSDGCRITRSEEVCGGEPVQVAIDYAPTHKDGHTSPVTADSKRKLHESR